jgi:predicted ATPase
MIRFFRLYNFKCFEDRSFVLGPLTLLSGLNGMGKSSLLQALLLLRQSFQQELLPSTGLALNGDMVHLGTAQDALFQGAKEEIIAFEMALEDGTEAKWRFNYNREADVMDIDIPSPINDIFKFSLFTDNFHYLKAERIGPRTSFEISDFQVRRHRQIGTRGEYAEYFLSVFGDKITVNDRLLHPHEESPFLHSQVESWMGEVSPGTRIRIDPHPGMDVVNLQYSFKPEVTNWFRSTNVGFGITYTLPLLVALLSSAPGSLLLFENPEAHLHPKGQVQMGELIARAASCGIQTIVETHSDHVLNGIRLAVYRGLIDPDKVQLHFFERRKQEGQSQNSVISPSQISVVSPKIDRNGRIDCWPDGFFDLWDKCLEALLEPKDQKEF